jgi:hypothetical protein
MIPAGHEHVWQPFAVRELGDGRRQIDSRCQCANAGPDDPGTVMEQRILVDADGRPLRLQYRFGGLWFDPLDLLRMRPSVAAGTLTFCPECGGTPPLIEGLGPCPTCNGIGVTVDTGEPVAAPELTHARA